MVTKEKICEAVVQLAKRKSIDKITVKDIVEECRITRQTFYYHFHDITDAMRYSLHLEVCRLAAQNRPEATLEDVLVTYCTAIVTNKYFIMTKLLNSRYAQETGIALVESIKEYMDKFVRSAPLKHDLTMRDAEFLMEYHSWAVIGLILQKMKKGNVDVRTEVQNIIRVMTGELHC